MAKQNWGCNLIKRPKNLVFSKTGDTLSPSTSEILGLLPDEKKKTETLAALLSGSMVFTVDGATMSQAMGAKKKPCNSCDG